MTGNLINAAVGVWYIKDNHAYDQKELLEFLYEDAKNNGKSFSRCCFHKDTESRIMAMLIVFVDQYIYPAHKHEWKDESYYIVEGECIYREYDKQCITSEIYLGPGNIVVNESKAFHQIIPLSSRLAMIEHTTGPWNIGQRMILM